MTLVTLFVVPNAGPVQAASGVDALRTCPRTPPVSNRQEP